MPAGAEENLLVDAHSCPCVFRWLVLRSVGKKRGDFEDIIGGRRWVEVEICKY